jgi:hypothetical protein
MTQPAQLQRQHGAALSPTPQSRRQVGVGMHSNTLALALGAGPCCTWLGGGRSPALTGGWHRGRRRQQQQLPAGTQHRHSLEGGRPACMCPRSMSAACQQHGWPTHRPLTQPYTNVCSMPEHPWGCKQSGARLLPCAATRRKKLHGTERAPHSQHDHRKNIYAFIIPPAARRPSIAARRQHWHGQST